MYCREPTQQLRSTVVSRVSCNVLESTLEADSHADTTCLGGESSNSMIKIVLSMSKGMTPHLVHSNIAKSVVPSPM